MDPVNPIRFRMRCRIAIAGLCLATVSQAGLSASLACNGPQQLSLQVRAHPSARAWGALGGWFGEQHNFPCALSAFQAAVRLDPASSRMHYFLGLTLYSSGKASASVGEFRRSIELDKNDIEPRLALGVALHQLNQNADAENAWETALSIDPDSVTALDWLAKARISDGQFGAAIELLSTAPHDVDLILDLALAYSQAGQFDKAAATLNAALSKSPGELRLSSALAAIYAQSHRYQDATNLMRATLKLHPGDAAAELLYLRLLVLQDDDTDAQPIARRLLASHPSSFDPLYLSGVIENDMQDWTAAAEHLKAAVALNPNHYDAHFNLGIALSHLQQNEAAREQLEKALALDSSKAEAHFHLAQVLRALGQTDEAKTQLKLFQERQQATTNLALGQTKAGQAAAALDAGNAVLAVSLYRDAITALPQDAVLRYDLALALDRTGDAAAERAALEIAVQLRPGFAEAENQLGYITARAGDFAAAEKHFRNALAAAPSYAEAENNLGTLLGQENRDSEAEICFRSAVTVNPRYSPAWINLAATLASESRFSAARDAIERALRLDPKNADALRLRQMLPTVQSDENPTSGSAPARERSATQKPN